MHYNILQPDAHSKQEHLSMILPYYSFEDDIDDDEKDVPLLDVVVVDEIATHSSLSDCNLVCRRLVERHRSTNTAALVANADHSYCPCYIEF